MDRNKAFEIINSIVAGSSMSRQDHVLAVQALELLRPAPDDNVKQAEKEIITDE